MKTKYGQKRTVPHRRKRENRTDYKQRLALLKSGTPRLVVRCTNNTIVCQVVEFHPDGDMILAAASSRNLAKLGWKSHPGNMPSSYLTGLLAGVKAKKAGVKKVILDLGLQGPSGSRIFSALKGVVDAGLDIPHSDEVLPSDDRVSGKHIEDYARSLEGDAYKKQFSYYLKRGGKPEELTALFKQVKDKILAM